MFILRLDLNRLGFFLFYFLKLLFVFEKKNWFVCLLQCVCFKFNVLCVLDLYFLKILCAYVFFYSIYFYFFLIAKQKMCTIFLDLDLDLKSLEFFQVKLF